MIRLISGKVIREELPFTASVELAQNTLLEWTSGYLAAADDNDTDLAGVLAETIAATDVDYATTGKKKSVIIPVEKHCVWEIDTGDTFVAATHQGVECGISDSGTVDLDDTTNDVFKVIGPGSKSGTIRGYLKINGSY
jgi:hypothetical protein